MREIKFRVLDGDELFPCGVLPTLMSNGFTACIDNYDSIRRVRGSVMQFTGLKDKRFSDVYEGDIIKSFHFTDSDDVSHFLYFEVKWSERFNGWVAVRSDGTELQLWAYCKSVDGYFYVIGNIYENPELLD